MKKLFFSTLALCLIVSSCSNNELLNSQMNTSEKTAMVTVESDGTPGMRKARAAAFVRQNPTVFGTNVRIFESYDELDSTLAVLQDMDYQELRQWVDENNVESNILESNIIYDQEWAKAWELIEAKPYPGGSVSLHATLPPGYGNIFVSPAEKALNQFLKTMHEKYPQYLLEYDSIGNHYVETLGSIDEMAFCNHMNLFIIGDEVHRFFGTDEVICDVADYSKIAKMKNINEVKKANASNTNSPYFITNKSHTKEMRSTNNANYVVNVNIRVRDCRTILGIDRRNAYVTVTNYQIIKKNYVQRYCKTDLKVRMTTTCGNSKNKHTHTYTFDHNCKMKNRTFNHIKYFQSCGFPISISSYTIKVSNSDGAAFEITQ